MKTKYCINSIKLLPLLEGYALRKIDTIKEGEEYFSSKEEYYFATDDVCKVRIDSSTFSKTMTLFLVNGQTVKLWAKNINSNDASLLRINKTTYISPELIVNDNYIELTSELVEWLTNIANVSALELETMTEEFLIEEEIEYLGVPSPVKMSSSWGYSNAPLTLTSSEINTVLNSIEDETLRKKIECILNARVFKKKY